MQNFNLNLEELVAILNAKLSAAVNKELNRKFKAVGLDITTEQWTILSCLAENKSLNGENLMTQQMLSTYTGKDKASITRLLDSLEKNNLIIRKGDKKDRRVKIIHLTEAANKIKKLTEKIISDTVQMAVQDITTSDLVTTRNTLLKILENFSISF